MEASDLSCFKSEAYFFLSSKSSFLAWFPENRRKTTCSARKCLYLCNGKSVRPAPTELPQARKGARVSG
jgi:hypothetical protein